MRDDPDEAEYERRYRNSQRHAEWLEAIENFERGGREKGNRDGAIGQSGEIMASAIASWCDGPVLEHDLSVLAASARLSRSTASKAVKRLQESGFLEYQRGARGRPSTFRPVLTKGV